MPLNNIIIQFNVRLLTTDVSYKVLFKISIHNQRKNTYRLSKLHAMQILILLQQMAVYILLQEHRKALKSWRATET